MSGNGKRRPPRPRIELLTPAASDSEAAAIVAAVEQFIADTAPAETRPGQPGNRWQRVALLEGVAVRSTPIGGWNDPEPWGAD